jgi:hypothetical protein
LLSPVVSGWREMVIFFVGKTQISTSVKELISLQVIKKTKNIMKALLQMKKLDIDKLKQAYNQE